MPVNIVPPTGAKLLFEYTIDELVVKLNDADAALAASYFDNLFGAPAIAKILDNANLSIQKGQEIVDAMSNPSKIGSGGRRGVIGDDWEDNKLTTRDGAAAVATTLEKIFQSFRPEWSITSGSDRVAAQNNRLEMWNVKGDSTEVLMSISQTNTDLTCKFKWTFDKPSYKTQIRFIKTDGGDYYYVQGGVWSSSENNITLCKNVGGGESILLDSGTASSATAGAPDQEVKVVKSGSNFELFVNGVSKGTATDSDITTSNVFEIRGMGGDLEDTGDSRCHIDNFEIY